MRLLPKLEQQQWTTAIQANIMCHTLFILSACRKSTMENVIPIQNLTFIENGLMDFNSDKAKNIKKIIIDCKVFGEMDKINMIANNPNNAHRWVRKKDHRYKCYLNQNLIDLVNILIIKFPLLEKHSIELMNFPEITENKTVIMKNSKYFNFYFAAAITESNGNFQVPAILNKINVVRDTIIIEATLYLCGMKVNPISNNYSELKVAMMEMYGKNIDTNDVFSSILLLASSGNLNRLIENKDLNKHISYGGNRREITKEPYFNPMNNDKQKLSTNQISVIENIKNKEVSNETKSWIDLNITINEHLRFTQINKELLSKMSKQNDQILTHITKKRKIEEVTEESLKRELYDCNNKLNEATKNTEILQRNLQEFRNEKSSGKDMRSLQQETKIENLEETVTKLNEKFNALEISHANIEVDKMTLEKEITSKNTEILLKNQEITAKNQEISSKNAQIMQLEQISFSNVSAVAYSDNVKTFVTNMQLQAANLILPELVDIHKAWKNINHQESYLERAQAGTSGKQQKNKRQ